MEHVPDPALRPVALASVTLGVAIGVFGVVFGVGAVSAGGSIAQACVMSLLVFTGASQFTAVGVIASGGSMASALGGGMLLAARNAVYGLTLSQIVGGSLLTRLAAAHMTIDETTAMATSQAGLRAQRTAFWITGATIFVCWNVGTLVGALAGSAIDPLTFGLDAAFPAGFVAMVAPQLRHRRALLTAVVGAAISLVLIPFSPPGVPILGASAAILLGVPRPDADDDPADLPGTAGVP
ncbi:MAG: AzlC family ABC transporter permease [Ilumatobacteraceae bacterium]